MQYKKFGKFDFKKIHPAGNLGAQLKTVEDIMLIGNKIPFVKENLNMKRAIKILSKKKLGVLIVQNKQKKTIGIITDGQIRRYNEKKQNLNEMNVAKIMTKNPISIDKQSLAAKALALMNEKKITSLCVNDKKNKYKTIGNFDTIFSKNVIINYLDNKITGEYLDFSMQRNSMIISRNVIYTNLENILKADVIEIDITTKDTKIFMFQDNKKVNIKSKD
jgi:CBS domain-containing protein